MRTFIFITTAISFLLTMHYMQNVKSAMKVLSFTLCMHLNKQLHMGTWKHSEELVFRVACHWGSKVIFITIVKKANIDISMVFTLHSEIP